MHTLKRLFSDTLEIPSSVAWYLAFIAEAKGKQDLYKTRSPQKLKILREHALIESAVSSNRIEGIEIEKRRAGTVVFGRPLPRDRNEEEIQGYRNALQLIHKESSNTRFSQSAIMRIHSMIRGQIWDAGQYKEKDGDILEHLPSGGSRSRFRTVSAAETPSAMKQLVSHTQQLYKDGIVHPLIIIAACNLDFLCIHPFRDGNGRVSRILLLFQLYQAGYEVGRYISLERLIEEYKERYYETLEISSQRWHSAQHDPWPYINFLLYILKAAYSEFMEGMEEIKIPRGGKKALVLKSIESFQSEFTLTLLQEKCLGVSRDTIRKVLKDLKKEGEIVSRSRGPGARWYKRGTTPK